MTIWLQKSASIRTRTSLLKFDHFRYPKPDFTASDASTKVLAADAQAVAWLDVAVLADIVMMVLRH